FQPPASSYISSLSLHDALPILKIAPCSPRSIRLRRRNDFKAVSTSLLDTALIRSVLNSSSETGSRSIANQYIMSRSSGVRRSNRSEEHTSELQSRSDLVCRLLL